MDPGSSRDDEGGVSAHSRRHRFHRQEQGAAVFGELDELGLAEIETAGADLKSPVAIYSTECYRSGW